MKFAHPVGVRNFLFLKISEGYCLRKDWLNHYGKGEENIEYMVTTSCFIMAS